MGRPPDPHARDDLLTAAEHEFVNRGVEGARVEDIAKRANRAKGAFYLHFASKEDAFRAVMDKLVKGVLALVDPPPAEVPRSHAELVAMAQRAFDQEVRIFTVVWNQRALARLMLYGAAGGHFEHLTDALVDGSRSLTTARFQWGRQHGIYRPDLDVETAAVMVGGAYERAARQMVRMTTPPDIPRLIIQLERMVARAIGSDRYVAAVEDVAATVLPPSG